MKDENDCIFCKIVNGEIPSKKVFENEYVYAFYDIEPVAPVHVLVIPKKHIKNINEVNDDNMKYVTEIINSIKQIAKICDIKEDGYRIITNCGKNGGQTVNHLHFHIIGGKNLGMQII